MNTTKVTILTIVYSFIFLVACSKGDTSDTLEKNKIYLESPYSDNTDTYELKYLSDGLEVKGFLLKPKKIRGEAPLLIFNRGGNQNFSKINHQTLNYLSYWAEQGYVVIASQYRGSDGGEGKDEFGGSEINDVKNLINVAVDLPYVDEDQKVMLGMSRGGIMTYQLIKEKIEIDAAVVIGGITDLNEWYYYSSKSLQQTLDYLIGGNPKNKSEEYNNRSSIQWANDLDTPLLILHGEKDKKVPVSHARQLVKELESLEKVYKYIEYPGANHSLSEFSNEYTQEITDWFEKHKD